MDRKTMISNYIDNVYKELDEKKEQPAVPAGGGLAAKPVKPVVEEDDTEERQGIVSRVGNMLLGYFKSDDDDTTTAMTTSPVTLNNAAKQAALNDLSIVDIIRANRDTPKDSGLINIPRKAPKKPEVRINVQEILSGFTPPTLPDAPTPTPSAPGGEAPSGKGLMSPDVKTDTTIEKKDETVSELQTYKTDYAEVYLKLHEGVKAHKSKEGGKDTAAYGVKFSEGLNRKDYTSDSEFAAAVALKHKDKVIDEFDEAKRIDTWNTLADSVKYAIVDLRFNNGTIGTTAKKATTEDMLKNTLAYIGMTTKAKEKVSLISLAKRRAWNWNKTISDTGLDEIKKIKQIPTAAGGTKFEYLDKDGKIIETVTTSRKPVKLDEQGVATTLTKTREINL